MKSMAVTKSDMALLSQEQLTQATFGALCQSFAMQILGRSGYEDGMYQRVALEFLEEESEQPQQPVQNVFNIDLNLVLETIRKEAQNQKREKKETEKLLEQVLRIQQAAEQKQIAMSHPSPVERTYLLVPQHSTVTRQSITVHNSFHQHGAAAQSAADRRRLQQVAGRAEQEVRAQFDLTGSQTRPIPGGPGSLSSRTAQFVKQMQEGRDLMEPGNPQPQEQPVIQGRKNEQAASLQQALQPAAEMELKTEPVQTPETGKTAAEAVAEAMKTAVERQLQNLQAVQTPAETRKERSPEQQEAGRPSQPEAQREQGQPITTQTIGQKALQPQSATHIQQEIPVVQSAEEKNLRNRSEINQRRSERLSQTAAALGKEAAMTAAGEIRVTGQQTGTGPDASVQVPAPIRRQTVFDTRTREELSFLQTEEAAQAESHERTGPVLSEEQQREQLLRTLSIPIREPLTQTIRQDIRITGGRPDRAVAASRSAEKTTQQNTTDKLQETKAQNTVQPIHAQSSAAAQQPSGSEQSGLTKTDIQFLSESQGAKLLETARQDTKPISQRDIRVAGSGAETTVAQEQAEQSVISTALSPMGSTEELAFRQETEAQTAVQPDHAQRSAAQSANISQPNPAVMQLSHTNRSLVDQRMIGGERTVFPSYVTGLTEADLQFLSESQRTQVLEAAKQDTKPIIQQDIRVAGSGLETTVVQEQAGQPVNSAMLPPMSSTEELTFRQETEAQTAVQPGHAQRSATQSANLSQPNPAVMQPSHTNRSVVDQQMIGGERTVFPSYANGLTEANLQFPSESQSAQVLEAAKQDTKPIIQQDIRVAGSGLETTVVQEQTEQPIISAMLPPMSSTEELTFRQETETQTAVQPMHTQSTAAAQQPRGSEQFGVLGLTEKALQFLSENQETQLPETIKQDRQPISQRDIRVAGNGLESTVAQRQAEQTEIPVVIPHVSGTEELTFHQKDASFPQPEKADTVQIPNTQNPPAQSEGSKEQSSVAAVRQATNTGRPLSPTYTSLLRTFASGLTEADLQFLSEDQRARVLAAVRQGAQPISQRDIRVAGSGLESAFGQEQAEQSSIPTMIPPMGGTEELSFRQDAEEQVNVQPEKPVRADPSRVLHPAEQSNLPKTRQSAKAERPLSPTYTSLLRTFAPGLTEADLQFLSEGQRAQVLETIRQGAPSVPSIGGRDIRVTANSPEQSSVVTEQAPSPAKTWNEGIRSEELTFRQKKEPQSETMDSQRASVEQFAVDKAQAVSKRDNRAIPSRKQANPIPDAAHSVNRDIRVLTDHGTDQMTVRAGEPIKSMPVGDLTPAELALLSQSQQHTIQGRLSHLQTESADQMMQSAAMDELHHRQMQPGEPSVSKTDASDSTIQPQPGQTRSAPADIRILRQLGVARPMGQQSRETPEQKKLFQTPSPVDLQLPTGADVGQRAAEKPVQGAEHVGRTPVNLTYSPAMVLQQSQPPKDPTVPAADTRSASAYVNSLPQWAQNFVRSGSATPIGITPPAPIAGVAREIASLPGNGSGNDGQTMDWSAPNRPQMANQAAHRPAEVVFKEQDQEEERQRQSVHMSESELRRTADKIYQIIEDRIRRERRLLGL